MVTIGIAMLQGARHAHIDAIHRAAIEMSLDVEIVELRTIEDLQKQVTLRLRESPPSGPGRWGRRSAEFTQIWVKTHCRSRLKAVFKVIFPKFLSYLVASKVGHFCI